MANGATPLSVPAPTFVGLLWPARAGTPGAVRAVVLAVIGSVLLTVSAKLQVPFWPVPMTMQTLVVLVLGAAYGWRLASATVLLYLVEGALGLPVFAGTPQRGIGLAYMLGPTGGFLVGFLAAAAVTGYLAERGWDRSLPRVIVMMTIGHLVIFAFGLAWLASLVGWSKAWLGGAAPFVLATVLKTALAVALAQVGWRLVRR